jgi:hypothetical protein
MPMVKGKKFPYTKEGKAAAEKAKKKSMKAKSAKTIKNGATYD